MPDFGSTCAALGQMASQTCSTNDDGSVLTCQYTDGDGSRSYKLVITDGAYTNPDSGINAQQTGLTPDVFQITMTGPLGASHPPPEPPKPDCVPMRGVAHTGGAVLDVESGVSGVDACCKFCGFYPTCNAFTVHANATCVLLSNPVSFDPEEGAVSGVKLA